MKIFLVKKSGLSLRKYPSAKTLMLIHGWGMNSQVWQPIRDALESQYHIIWVDLPGHGFNRDIEAVSLENMVELISTHTPDNTHIMAWSLGGLVAQALANKIPQHIKSMTLVATTPRFSQTVNAENDEWTHAMTETVLNRFADNLKQDTVRTLKGFIALQFIGLENAKQAQSDLINYILYNKDLSIKWGGGSSEEDINQNKIKHAENPDKKQDLDQNVIIESEPSNIPTQEALDVGLSILKHADLRELSFSGPEHWVFAEYDRLIPKEVINDLKFLRPDAEITLLKKAGHAPFITHSKSFLTSTLEFIETLD